MPERLKQLNEWLTETLGRSDSRVEPLAGDASFRRYFRVHCGDERHVAMDAPPDREDCRPFIRVAEAFSAIGLHVPEIRARDLDQGFLLLSDLGDRLYLDVLQEETVDRLYGDALGALTIIQACGPREGLPPYDRDLLMREMELFREWLLERHLGLTLDAEAKALLRAAFDRLADNALEQPRVCVHRDYHSRNLMLTTSPNPGILDFQDAVLGPVTYDLVSLLRDCYIDWPRARVEAWARGYFDTAVHSGVLREEHETHFMRWFDLMGMQRHLKAAGIFARLDARDGKPGYLGDIPRTLGYIVEVAPDYAEMAPLGAFIAEQVLPALTAKG